MIEFVSSDVLKNPRLAQFIGNPPERRESTDVSFMLSTEEVSRILSDYANKVQEAVNPHKTENKSKR